MGHRRTGWPRPSIRRLAAGAVGVTLLTTMLADPAAAQPGGPTDFSSSFEAGDPQPTWTDTAETDPAGNLKAAGVNSDDPTRIPGDITDKVAEVTANGENSGSGEVKENLVDHDPQTKWLVFEPTGWVQFKFTEPVDVVRYAMTSANDFPGRDPRDWTLKGSADGQSWTTLDTQTGQAFDKRFQTKEYKYGGGTEYLYYRFDFTANNGDEILQLAEIQFSETTPQAESRILVVPNMSTVVGDGPTSAFTAKPKAGFTGRKAFRYVGTHLAAGRAYSYNKVFDVNVVVTPTSRLSYLIFPEFLLDDLNYPSTHAAIDLAFTDGTYLSDLKAVDHHGNPLTPQGQAASRTLYTQQWNNIVSDIGKVAAGKTVDRILLAYDNPKGPTGFKGWVDDIKIVGAPQAPNYARPSDYVLTTRGTNATSGFSRGNNFPATAVPHGFNFWTPMTNAGSTSWLYDYARANNADNLPTLQAFTVSHEPSPWMGDRQTFQVMPSTADVAPDAGRAARALPFKHSNEIAKAHYYSVQFENGVRTEIAPTDHAAVFRFGFPRKDGNTAPANLIFDNVNNNGGLTLDAANRTISGFSDVRSGLSAGAGRLFVYATFDKPVTASGMLPGGGGANVTGYLKFDTGADTTVTMRIATSLLGVEQARKNLEQEISPADTVETVSARAQAAWDAKLKIIEVEGATEDQLITLYSNLYRLFLYPNSGFENTGTPQAPKYKYASAFVPNVRENTPTQTGAKIVDGKVYVNNGFWDTYRTTWPAYALLAPTQAGEMVDGFVQQYRDGGWISRWSSPGYANLMTGTSSDVSFADAYLKGITNFDARGAYDAAIRNATVTPPNQSVGRKGIDKSIFLGYTPTSTGEGMSWALEGYINDFGIAKMAQALADKAAPDDPRKREYLENAEYFRNRAQNYVTMFDPAIGFFQGKTEDGKWRTTPETYDPREWGYDYTETNGWNMAFTVPHDGQGLANLYGGRDKLAAKLDKFFSEPETARFPGSYGGTIHEMLEARDVRMGQYGHSNQPSHHIPYMYNYTGQPSKTQQKVRDVTERLYIGSEIGQGYPGDEDNGEMSAWWLFSALGFYPLQMGAPTYALGSPLFTKATVNLENGRKLVVNAPKNSKQNIYVQGLKVNGKPYDKTFLTHDMLAGGATLDFDMGPKPSAWGSGADAVPPSLTTGTEVAKPLRDTANLTGALFDNTSQTEATASVVEFKPARPHDVVEYYTVTSGKTDTADPKAWVLKGSFDGKNWAIVDSRANESFQWRQQTKPFKLAKPSRYTQYRLEFAGAATVAELEFLAKPTPACAQTITGTHNGPLRVTGVVCLQDATVNGPVQIDAGGSLYAFGGTITGPVSATQAAAVALIGTKVSGPVTLAKTRGEITIGAAEITGPVSLVDNAGPVMGSSTVNGPVDCTGNNPPPANNGLANTVNGPRSGQCGQI
ncbi:alpha-1,2-mannosidase, putative [Kibdelosporangium aridum]|uniref:Alpha-1,2-mannosidase, putative n=2 Tax=Kibdelosporangium aridum TaxID=2030 RepID=A0A1W2BGC4_KIBAR|nr:alpha-1,2-mannosidase, putative [Kibdelosporangium aridum]